LLKVFTDPVFIKHDTGSWHPESPSRLEAVTRAFKSIPKLCIESSCPQAKREEIELIHTPEYFNYISSQRSDRIIMLDPDTAFSPASKEASLKAVGAAIETVKFSCHAENNRSFCAVRPPGHHAEPDRAMGFCIFNNVAIGAAYALANGLAEKVTIIDWDVHHGNGTQKAFYSNPQVQYISLHQYPFYPGSGSADETGEGDGKGYTINLPMKSGSGDDDYRKAFLDIILPAIDDFKPELIMISAGFDAYIDDPLAGIRLSIEFFGEMTRMIIDSAKKHCHGRIVSSLEGGYDIYGLTETVKLHLKVLNDE